MGIYPGCPYLSGNLKIIKITEQMKKLNLGKLKVRSMDILEKNQMKTIYGGLGGSGSTCYLRCDGWVQSMEVNACNLQTVRFYCGSDRGATCNCT